MKSIKSKTLALFNKLRKLVKSGFISFSKLMKISYNIAKGKAISFVKIDTNEVREMTIESIVSIRSTGQIVVSELGNGTRSFYIQNII